jgi:tol-pal system protein YbgF
MAQGLVMIGLPLAAFGCVATGGDLDQVRGDLNTLRREVQALSQTSDGNRKFLEQRIAKLETRVDEEGPRGRAELAARIQELSSEVRLVQGKLEENAHAMQDSTRRADEAGQRLAALNTRVLAVEGQVRAMQQGARVQTPLPGAPPAGETVPPSSAPPPAPPAPPDRLPSPPPFAGQAPPPAPPPPPAAAPAPPPPIEPRFTGMSADQIYSAALTDYTKQSYDLAIRGFQAFIAQFPKDSRVPDAQFWLANSHYAQQNYALAVREFEVLVRDYPDNPKASSAMLNQGRAYLEANDAAGCRVLKDLVAKYGRTRQATLARDALRQNPLCK